MLGNSNLSLVSVVIACFNDYQDIEQAVSSILNQTYNNIEIIVVDDGSDFKTKEVLKKLEPKITKLITQDNQGQSIARNNGIKHARGVYILNLDSDDFFEPTFCEKAINKFQSDKSTTIVTCLARRFGKMGDSDTFIPKGGRINNFLFSNAALGSSMFKREDWKYCGGYEEKLPILGFEDWEFYINILKKGGYAHVLNEELFNYQIRENSTTDRIRDLRLEKFKHIIYKHKDLYLNNFEGLIENLFYRIKKESDEKVKNTNRIEFLLGKSFLKPIRFIKSLFK
jgi:glycosyltransferase involved in cell wall biosynthesis